MDYDPNGAVHQEKPKGGWNLNGVAYLLGHKQVTTTNKYVHASQQSAASVLEALDALPRPGSKCGSRESADGALLSETSAIQRG
jgi:hypothetical protein